MNVSPKKILTISALFIIGLITFLIVHYFLTTGRLVVTTDSPSQITITKPGSSKKYFDKKVGRKADVRLKNGLYFIHVTKADNEASKVVTVASSKTTSVNLSPKPLLHITRVFNFSTDNFIVRQNDIVALSGSPNNLFRLSSSGAQIFLPNLNNISSVRWFNDHQALAQIASGTLAYVDGIGSSVLNDPVFESLTENSTQQPFVYAINRANNNFVVGIGNKVYLFSSPTSPAKLIYTSNTPIVGLGLMNSKVLVYQPFESEGVDKPVLQNTKNVLIDINTGKQVVINDSIESALTSPDGTRLVYSSTGVAKILGDSMGDVVDVLPTDTIRFAWESSNELIYADSSSVWQYSLPQKESIKLANSIGGNLPVGLFIEPSSKTIYFSLNPNQSQAAIYALTNSSSSQIQIQEKLNSVTPYRNADFEVTYSNFNNYPVITITTFALLNRAQELDDYNRQSLQFRQEALNYLKSKDIDISKFTIQYIPVNL